MSVRKDATNDTTADGSELTALAHDTSAVFGRSREMRALDAAASLRAPVVSIRGSVGIGKTALARAWLARSGSAWVEVTLASARTWHDVVLATRTALDAELERDAPGNDGSADLARTISDRGTSWVLFDGCDGLDDEARAWMLRFASAAKSTQILATSRTALLLGGEVVVEVPPLQSDDARALFLSLARLQSPELGYNAPDDAALAEIVRLLEGHPLAIHVAASWLDVMSLEELTARLAQGRLAILDRDEPETPRSGLRSALEASVLGLQPSEREALFALCVFEDSFDFAAAEAIVSGSSARRVLSRLREHSLVERTAPPAHRLRMSAFVRELAILHAPQELLVTARNRHAEWLARQLASLQPVDEAGHAVAIRFAAEWGADIVAAATYLWASDSEHGAARAADLLWELFDLADRTEPPRGATSLAQRLLAGEQTLGALRRARLELLLDVSLVAQAPWERWTELLAHTTGEPGLRTALVLRRAAARAHAWGKQDAQALLTRAIDALGSGFGARATALAISRLFFVVDVARDPNVLDQAVRELARLRAEDPPARVLLQSLFDVAAIAIDEGRTATARALLDEAASTAERARDARRRSSAHYYLALVALDEGNLVLAQAHQPQQIPAHRDSPYAVLIESLALLAAHDASQARRRLDALVGTGSSLFHRLAELLRCRVASESGEALPAPPGPWTGLDTDVQAYVALELALREVCERRRVGAAFDDARSALRDALGAAKRWAARSLLLRVQLRSVRALVESVSLDAGLEPARWVIDEVAHCVVTPDGERVDLAQQPLLSRLLHALLEHARTRPATVLDTTMLAKAGWPGERMLPKSARERVKANIARLRKLGLRELIEHVDGGYRIAPNQSFVLKRTPGGVA